MLGDRYRLVAKLGQGGMGTVYLAEHVVLGKNMAVKVLREELSRDEELVKRFQQEAVAASRIGHENIVNVTDFGRSPEGALYFVMEYLEGQSLTRLIRQGGPMPLERAVPILAQICRALAAAHSRGIVHRDLKPDNVMVVRREDGSDLVKVLDFGISKVHTGNASDSGRLTRVGMVMGTPEYMAPEQVEASSVDHRVDIYSLGAVAYELVTGKLPFEANTPVAMLMKHQSEPLVPIRTRRPDLNLPDALDRLIVKAMSKRPAERQQSMQEVLSELAAIGAQIGSAPIFTPVPGSIVLDALAMPSANDERPTPSPPVAEPDVAFAPTTVRPTPADLAVPRDTVLGRTPLPSAAAEAVAPADDGDGQVFAGPLADGVTMSSRSPSSAGRAAQSSASPPRWCCSSSASWASGRPWPATQRRRPRPNRPSSRPCRPPPPFRSSRRSLPSRRHLRSKRCASPRCQPARRCGPGRARSARRRSPSSSRTEKRPSTASR